MLHSELPGQHLQTGAAIRRVPSSIIPSHPGIVTISSERIVCRSPSQGQLSDAGQKISPLYYLSPRDAFAYIALEEADQSSWSFSRRWMCSIISRPSLNVFMGLVIVANAIVIGLEMDLEGENTTTLFQGLDVFFLSLFVLELSTKLFVYRAAVFRHLVNIFDAIIVACGVIALLLHISQSHAGLKDDMRKFSLLKLARLLRLIRIIRLSTQFHSLWMLVQGLCGCMSTVLWTTVLLMTVTYFFAILAMEYISSDEEAQNLEFANGVSFGERFASIPRSLISLLTFFAIENVSNVGWNVIVLRPWVMVYLLAWTLMVPIVLLNLITAVIVEISINAAKKDKYHRQMLELEEWQRICKDYEILFLKMTYQEEELRQAKSTRSTTSSKPLTEFTASGSRAESSFTLSGSRTSHMAQKVKDYLGGIVNNARTSVFGQNFTGDVLEELMDDRKLTKERVHELSGDGEVREKLNTLFGEAPTTTRGFERLMELWVVLDTDDDGKISMAEFTEGMGRLHNVIHSHNSDTFVMLRMVHELKKAAEERAQQASILTNLQQSQDTICQQLIALRGEVSALAASKFSEGGQELVGLKCSL